MLLVRIAIIIAVPFLVADALSSHQIISADYVKYYEGELYGLDRAENKDYLFRYNVQKNSGRVVSETGIEDITVSEDGKIYLLKTANGKSDLLEWNKHGSVKTIIGVAEVEGMTPKRILASNKGIFYIYYESEARDEIQRLGYNAEWKPVGEIQHYDADGFFLEKAKIPENGEIYFVSANGSIYGAVKDGAPQLIFDVNAGPEDNSAYANYRFTPYTVSFVNTKSGNHYSVSLTSEDHTPAKINMTYSPAKTFDDIRLHNPEYTGDTVKAGGLFLDNGYKGAAVCGDVEAIVSTIEWSALQYIVTLLLIAALLGLLAWLLRKQIAKLEDKMFSTDITILISITVVLMVICIAVSNIVAIKYLKKHQIEQTKSTCMELADTVVAQLGELDVDALSETGDTPLLDIYAEYGVTLNFYKICDGNIYYATQFRNPDVICEYCEPGISNVLSEAIQSSVQSGQIVQCALQYNNASNYGVIVPMGDLFEDPSALLVAIPMADFWSEFLVEVLGIGTLNLLILAIIFAVILLILHTLSKQLSGLMEASERVLAGELGAQADDKGNNEVAVAIRAFNRISANLKEEEISVANCAIMTRSFTPIGLMRQINGGFSDTVAHVGSEVQGKSQVLLIMIQGVGRPIDLGDQEECFEIISRLINALSKLGGSLMDVTFFSLRYVDAEMTRDLFRTIAPIIRDINMSGRYRVRAVLSVTDIKATIVGTGEYMLLDVYETKPRGTREIFEDAQEKGVSFMLTDFAAKIAGLDRYHFRKAGIFYASPSGRGEMLYEALDACPQSDARTRMDSRAIFERGLEDFYKGATEAARRAMALVLINDSNDTLARFYIKECEKYSNQKEHVVEE